MPSKPFEVQNDACNSVPPLQNLIHKDLQVPQTSITQGRLWEVPQCPVAQWVHFHLAAQLDGPHTTSPQPKKIHTFPVFI